MNKLDFIKFIYPAAKKIGGVNPVFTTAQAALESGWAKHIIGKYNLFGITKGKWTGKTILVRTTEVFNTPNVKFNSPESVISITKRTDGKYLYVVNRLFRDYETLEEALKDHLQVLLSPAFAEDKPFANDAKAYVKAIQTGKYHYATAPNYVEIMCELIDEVQSIINKNNL